MPNWQLFKCGMARGRTRVPGLNWNRKCSGMGVPIGDGSQDTIYTILYADGQDMEFMVRKLLEEYEKWGLKINLEKTFYMGCGAETKDFY